MNKEIKFEYGYNSVNGIVKKKYFLHEIPFMHEKCDVWNVLPLVYARQFTVLKDKNENEIYEGDILKTSNNIVSVFFGKHISYVTMLGKKDTIETNGWLVKNAKVHIDVLDESFCNGEVIGNIYENPELLHGSVVA